MSSIWKWYRLQKCLFLWFWHLKKVIVFFSPDTHNFVKSAFKWEVKHQFWRLHSTPWQPKSSLHTNKIYLRHKKYSQSFLDKQVLELVKYLPKNSYSYYIIYLLDHPVKAYVVFSFIGTYIRRHPLGLRILTHWPQHE